MNIGLITKKLKVLAEMLHIHLLDPNETRKGLFVG